MLVSISSKLIPCLRSFDALLARSELGTYEAEVPLAAWNDELGRLRIWAANIGAHQSGQSSLDYRLRDASHITQQILKLLGDLYFTLGEIEEVLAYSPLLQEEPDGEEETEVQQLYHGLSNIIKCLYQLSILTRRPARHDRLRQSHMDVTIAFQPFDRDHVTHKYPRADTATVERLALAISRRRAYLQYRERHHAKLSQGIEHVHDGTKSKTKSVVLSQTIATDYEDNMDIDVGDAASRYGLSQTSYAPSLQDGGATSVPPPPKQAAGEQPFQCPYCYFTITIKNRHSWTRHVFKDIMPYICVFANCLTPNKMYDSRHEWFDHEVKVHLKALTPSDATSEFHCPLCKSAGNFAQLERHLARHLEEMALFALPCNFSGDDDDSDKLRNNSLNADLAKEDLSSMSEDDLEQDIKDPQLQRDSSTEAPTRGRETNINLEENIPTHDATEVDDAITGSISPPPPTLTNNLDDDANEAVALPSGHTRKEQSFTLIDGDAGSPSVMNIASDFSQKTSSDDREYRGEPRPDPRDVQLDPRGSREIILPREGRDHRGGPRPDLRADVRLDPRDTRDSRDVRDFRGEPMIYTRDPRFAMPRDPRGPYDRDEMGIDPPTSIRLTSYFLPGEGISREVIQADICRYLGADSTCLPARNREGEPGYKIRAYRLLTSKMVEELMADSKRWDEELRRSHTRGTRLRYEDTEIHERRQIIGPTQGSSGFTGPQSRTRDTGDDFDMENYGRGAPPATRTLFSSSIAPESSSYPFQGPSLTATPEYIRARGPPEGYDEVPRADYEMYAAAAPAAGRGATLQSPNQGQLASQQGQFASQPGLTSSTPYEDFRAGRTMYPPGRKPRGFDHTSPYTSFGDDRRRF